MARLKTAFLIAGIVLGLVPAAASAAYDEVLPLTGVSPADAARIDPVSTPVPWQVNGSVKSTESSVDIQVSSQKTLGPDGSLAEDYRLDEFSLHESPVGSGNYSGRSVGGAGRWQDTPGTYYWMAVADFPEDPENYNSPIHHYRSKVFTLQVGGPPVAPTQPVAQPLGPAPLTPALPQPAAKSATTVVVHSHSVSHGHAKLRATCTPAPCALVTTSFVKIGKKWHPGKVTMTPVLNSVAQHLYVELTPATVRAIRAALKRHRKAKLYVEVDTYDRSAAVTDRDYLVLGLTKVSG